jgi:hypothetical protein
MLRSLALLPAVALVLLGNAPGNPKKSGTRRPYESALNPELQRVWKQFAQAIQASNFPALRQLSAACIQCTDCVTNTAPEATAFEAYKDQHPDTWYDQLYGSLGFIPAEVSWRKDAPLIFDAKTKLRLQNPAKLRFAANDHNKAGYVAPCLILPAQAASTHVDEVLVTYLDPYPAGQGEGMQKAFAFVRTKQGYKFCGYSTIP